MTRAAKVCSVPTCPGLRPCPAHPKVAWENSTRRERLPPDWERRRRSVLARDPVCRKCENRLSTCVDHIVPGDDHSLENLQGLCDPCHTVKTQREAAEARRAANQNF